MVIGIRIFTGTRSGIYDCALTRTGLQKNSTSVIFLNESKKVLLKNKNIKKGMSEN